MTTGYSLNWLFANGDLPARHGPSERNEYPMRPELRRQDRCCAFPIVAYQAAPRSFFARKQTRGSAPAAISPSGDYCSPTRASPAVELAARSARTRGRMAGRSRPRSMGDRPARTRFLAAMFQRAIAVHAARDQSRRAPRPPRPRRGSQWPPILSFGCSRISSGGRHEKASQAW